METNRKTKNAMTKFFFAPKAKIETWGFTSAKGVSQGKPSNPNTTNPSSCPKNTVYRTGSVNIATDKLTTCLAREIAEVATDANVIPSKVGQLSKLIMASVQGG